MKKEVPIIFGIIILIFSIWLAISLSYKHFYEIMLIGLLFILYPITKKYFKTKILIQLYVLFAIIGGLIADLLIGPTIGELWYYNYTLIFEYVLLYLIIYPLGGLVMIMSFLYFLKNCKLKKPKKISTTPLKNIAILSLIISITFIILKYNYNLNYSGFWFGSFFCLFIIFAINYYSEKKNKTSFISILLTNPKPVIITSLLGTYINAFIHEYPNVFAQQWVYQNMIFQNIQFLNIPLAVLVGWIILTVFPMSAYYLVKK
jgi:hypothetical protein